MLPNSGIWMNSRVSLHLFAAVLISFGALVGCGDFTEKMLSHQLGKSNGVPATEQSFPDREISGEFPPAKGQMYPDMRLVDQDGNPFNVEDFKGQVVFVELAAIPCGGCQAFAGANEKGGYLTSKVQSNLKSIHHYVDRFCDMEPGRDFVFVQLLIYNNDLKAPTQEEVAGWADHFGMKTEDRQYVVGAPPAILNQKTRDAIPGFHLIDLQGKLVADSCGHQPTDDLFSDLLPMLADLAKRKKRVKNRHFSRK